MINIYLVLSILLLVGCSSQNPRKASGGSPEAKCYTYDISGKDYCEIASGCECKNEEPSSGPCTGEDCPRNLRPYSRSN